MINLRDARITDGLPRIVAEQPWAQVLSAVYGELQDRMFEYLDTGMTFSEVDTCDEGVLDQMAVYLKIEWYDSTADVETKRRIVRTAIEIQRYAGTVKAVREQASAVYPDSEVEEWFDYGGTPGFWRLNVNITEAAAQYHTIREMEDLLGYTKRPTVDPGGTSLKTTLPAPIFELSPMVKEPSTFAPALIMTLLPMVG